ncbi:hemolysin-III related-domain-containing protein [Podospora aff. communis PSN243]|uniref:Hemolysin-III related-domain-containing protein n=1 Tax=Podospora aff. communis PSN243 TaxID=3040156 RepID=A0AAV9GGQ6_9PEZI|nr:hemolysin-III related-domain-containing protein [Podospora aff. communis PSN243]
MDDLELSSGSEIQVTQARNRFRGSAELRWGLEPLNKPEPPTTQPTNTIKNATNTVQLLLWHQLPAWQQEGNHFIETGYRPGAESFWQCLHSLTYFHNESVNIYSHAFGAILFAVIPLYVFNTEIPPRYIVATTADKIVLSIYFIGVAICFVFSVWFHTFFHHSPDTFSLLQKFDFTGVIVLMWGANVPLIYYGFICDPKLQVAYWFMTTSLALLCSVITFKPQFSDPHLRPFRAATFGCLALSTFIPVSHGLVKYGYETHSQRIGLRWILLTLLFNSLGAAAYASKFPEKWYPRQFDMVGASHQLFHIFIVCAGVMYGRAVLQEFDFLHSSAPSVCQGRSEH